MTYPFRPQAHGLSGLSWLCLALLSACGGGNEPLAMPTAQQSPLNARAEALMGQSGPTMETVLAQPRQTAAVRAPDSPTARRLDAGTATPHPDLIWLNAATGQTVSWTMDGLRTLQVNELYRSPDWRLTFTADLDGDGQDDYIWENAKTGQMAVWIMKGPAVSDATEIKVLLQLVGWKVTHVADFNGDGKDDIVFYNADTGQTVIWLMDGSTVLDSAVVRTTKTYRVATAADLDGDGRADLVWRPQQGYNNNITWMDGLKIRDFRATDLPLLYTAPDPRALDLDGSGRQALIVPGNSFYGSAPMRTFLIDRVADVSPSVGGTGQSQWEEATTAGDYFGDGRMTLLWKQNYYQDYNSGPVRAARLTSPLTNASAATWSTPMLVASPGWRAEHSIDLDGDGRDDVIWRNPQTGQTVGWLMKGFDVQAQAELLGLRAWQVVGARHVNLAPTANPGLAKAVSLGTEVKLDGSGSAARGGGGLAYSWTWIGRPSRSRAQLSAADTAQPSFTPDVGGEYTAQLVVTRGTRRSAPKRVIVTAQNPPSAVTEAAVKPLNHRVATATDYNISFRSTHELVPGDEIVVSFPSAWPLNIAYVVSPYGQTPPGQAINGVLRIPIPSGLTIPAGTRVELGDLVVKGSGNPGTAGVYVAQIKTTADPTPVDVQIRVNSSATAPTDIHVFRSTSAVGATTDFAFDFVAPNGLPAGSQIVVSSFGSLFAPVTKTTGNEYVTVKTVPDDWGITTLVYTVQPLGAVPPGGRLNSAYTRVEGVRNPTMITSTQQLRITSSEEDNPANAPFPGLSGDSSVDGVELVLDNTRTGQTANWSVKFKATHGIAAGDVVALMVPPAFDFSVDGVWQNYGVYRAWEPGGDTQVLKSLPASLAPVLPGSELRFSSLGPLSGIKNPAPGTYVVKVYTTLDSKPVSVPITITP